MLYSNQRSILGDSVTSLYFNYKAVKRRTKFDETFMMCRARWLMYRAKNTSSIRFEWIKIFERENEKTWFSFIWTDHSILLEKITPYFEQKMLTCIPYINWERWESKKAHLNIWVYIWRRKKEAEKKKDDIRAISQKYMPCIDRDHSIFI